MRWSPQLVSVNGPMTRPSPMNDDLAWAEAITLRLADSMPDTDELADCAPPQAVSGQT